MLKPKIRDVYYCPNCQCRLEILPGIRPGTLWLGHAIWSLSCHNCNWQINEPTKEDLLTEFSRIKALK